MEKPKQVIVMRKDLNMRKGKMVSQGAHASFKAFLDLCEKENRINLETGEWKMIIFRYRGDGPWDQWLNGIFTKVVVSCDSESELLDLYQKSKDKGLPCSLITDSGLTEFDGVPTNTCIAIGPSYPETIDEITGHLKLL